MGLPCTPDPERTLSIQNEMRFLQVLLGAIAIGSAVAAPTSSDAPVEKRKSKFLFSGVNESGAEFGSGNLPGQLNKDYTWPVHSTIDVRKGALMQSGMTIEKEIVLTEHPSGRL